MTGKPYVVAGRTYVPRQDAAATCARAWPPGTAPPSTAARPPTARSSTASRSPQPTRPCRCRAMPGHQPAERPLDGGAGQRPRALPRRPADGRVAGGGRGLDFRRRGTTKVRVEYVGKASVGGSDDRKLMATLRTDGTPAGSPMGANIMVADAGEDAKPFAFRQPEAEPVRPIVEKPRVVAPVQVAEAEPEIRRPVRPPRRSAGRGTGEARPGAGPGRRFGARPHGRHRGPESRPRRAPRRQACLHACLHAGARAAGARRPGPPPGPRRARPWPMPVTPRPTAPRSPRRCMPQPGRPRGRPRKRRSSRRPVRCRSRRRSASPAPRRATGRMPSRPATSPAHRRGRRWRGCIEGRGGLRHPTRDLIPKACSSGHAHRLGAYADISPRHPRLDDVENRGSMTAEVEEQGENRSASSCIVSGYGSRAPLSRPGMTSRVSSGRPTQAVPQGRGWVGWSRRPDEGAGPPDSTPETVPHPALRHRRGCAGPSGAAQCGKRPGRQVSRSAGFRAVAARRQVHACDSDHRSGQGACAPGRRPGPGGPPRGPLALPGRAPSAQAFQTLAPHAILIDADTGAVLFEKGADEPFSPASMAKLMTVEVLFDEMRKGKLGPDTEFTISENAWRAAGPGGGGSSMFASSTAR